MTNPWLSLTAADLGRGIADGTIDPVELTETYLAAIDAHPDAPRIYARTTGARARSEAQAASIRARHGQRRGLLDGVPISWKDLFDTAGTVTEAGTAYLEGRTPDADARVSFHQHLMAVMDQLPNTRRRQSDAIFVVFDFLWNTNKHC